MNEPGILREIEQVVGSLEYVVKTYRQAQASGSRLYEGESLADRATRKCHGAAKIGGMVVSL